MYPEAEVERAMELYRSGKTLAEVAQDVGCCPASVFKWLKERRIAVRKPGRKRKYSDEFIDKVVREFESGEKLRDLHEKHECSISAISTWRKSRRERR